MPVAMPMPLRTFVRAHLPTTVVHWGQALRHQLDTLARRLAGRGLDTPDRRVLEQIILPAIAADPACQRVLFVGCRWYTRRYRALFPGRQYWTIDIDPAQARHGAPGRHIVASYLDLCEHVPPQAFDAIVLNGVLGWGIDGAADCEAAFAETWRALAPGGVVVIGYNDTPLNRPAFLDSPSPLLARFEPWPLPAIGADHAVADSPGRHVFQLRRKPG